MIGAIIGGIFGSRRDRANRNAQDRLNRENRDWANAARTQDRNWALEDQAKARRFFNVDRARDRKDFVADRNNDRLYSENITRDRRRYHSGIVLRANAESGLSPRACWNIAA